MSHVIKLPADEIEARINKIPALETGLGKAATQEALTELSNSLGSMSTEDIANYYTKNDIDTAVLTKTDAESNYAKTSHTHSDYLTSANVPEWAMKSTKPLYTAEEVGALPASTKIPTAVSELTNDNGYITNTALSGYAKASDIPSLAGYAKTSDIPSLEGYAKTDDLSAYVKTGTLGSLATKNGLTASEVGADAKGTATGAVSNHNSDTNAHAAIMSNMLPRVLPDDLEGVLYGDTLPADAATGQIFFLRVFGE